MSEEKKEKKMCVFDYSMECPYRVATKNADSRPFNEIQLIGLMLEKACPICPIRIKMLPEERQAIS